MTPGSYVGTALQHAYADIAPVRLVETVANGVGVNSGPALRRRFTSAMRAGLWTPGWSWCAIWVTTILHELWPEKFIWTAGCSELAAWAMSKGILLDEPAMGALFVLGGGPPTHPFHHTGWIVDVGAIQRTDSYWLGAHTLEGNTNSGEPPSDNGWGVFERYGDVGTWKSGHGRKFRVGVDKFVHWWHILELGAAG